MLKLAVLVCLVVLVAAQTPTRPNIPETFDSQVFCDNYCNKFIVATLSCIVSRMQSNVDLHSSAGETLFGTGEYPPPLPSTHTHTHTHT